MIRMLQLDARLEGAFLRQGAAALGNSELRFSPEWN
jgi:hypothetical protein